MAKRWAVAVGTIGLAGCLAAGTEQVSGRSVADDRILPVTDGAGVVARLDAAAVAASWAEGRFAGVGLALAEPTEVVVTADAGESRIDPVVLVYGPRGGDGTWTARVAKVDGSEGPVERTGSLALPAGQYLIAVGEFERRAGGAAVTVARALTVQTVEVRGFVFGRHEGNDGRQSWGEACDAWHRAAVARLGAGATEDGFTCGEAVDLDSGSWSLLSSEPVLSVRAALAGAARSVGAHVVTGRGDGSMATALASWRTECATLEERMAALYGARILGISCGTPADADAGTNWFVYQSTPVVTLAPVTGGVVDATDLVFGAGDGAMVTALRSLTNGCEAWMDEQLARSGARLESIECGAPRDDHEGSNWYAYSATATARFALAAGEEAVSSAVAPVRGSGNGSDRTALSAWRTACDTRLDVLANELGAGFLGATCGTPRDVDAGSNWFQYESAPVVWLVR